MFYLLQSLPIHSDLNTNDPRTDLKTPKLNHNQYPPQNPQLHPTPKLRNSPLQLHSPLYPSSPTKRAPSNSTTFQKTFPETWTPPPATSEVSFKWSEGVSCLSNYDAIVVVLVCHFAAGEHDSMGSGGGRRGRRTADSSVGGRYETFGGQSFRGEPSVSYCSPSGRKTKFDQILLRRHKTDRLAGRPGLWSR